MKTRILTLLLAFMLVLGMIPGAAATETTEATGETKPVRGEFECGDDLIWSYDDGVLTVKGSGAMDDYEDSAPWAEYKDDIEEVVLEGVTYIGANAFRNYDELETVDFGSKLREIGPEAFRSCEGLEEIELPASFKIFGESSFMGCTNLKKIHCSGNFPSFRLNSMWECYATIYYPAERPWQVELIQQLENAFHRRIEFLASDGTDHYVPTEATTAPVETESPTTQMPTEETTVPTEETTVPTEAPTEVTEATTEVTEPETTAAVQTEETVQETVAQTVPTEPEVDEEAKGLSNQVVLLGMGIALALTMILALLLVIRQTLKKGKYAK